MMISVIRLILLSVALLLGLYMPSTAAEQNGRPIVIAGGTPFGYYFGLAGAICQAINVASPNAVRCVNVAGGSSALNLEKINDGSFDFAVIQSDWLHHAVQGSSRYRSAGPNEELRSIVSLPAEALMILARRDIGAKLLTHLAGRRVGYDGPNRYAYLLMQTAISGARIDIASRPAGEGQEKVAEAQICAGKIDVLVTVERHPSGHVESLMGRCDLNLISIAPATIKKAIEKRPELVAHQLSLTSPQDSKPAITTFGLSATIVTQSSTSDDHVAMLLEAILGSDLKKWRHIAFTTLPLRDQISVAVGLAPLHRRAKAHFGAKGWLP